MNDRPVVIVGAGFYGAVMAERFATAGRSVLVLDKRKHIGGNSWSRPDPETGVEEHVYGPHIFHTSDERAWKYANRFTEFNGYRQHGQGYRDGAGGRGQVAGCRRYGRTELNGTPELEMEMTPVLGGAYRNKRVLVTGLFGSWFYIWSDRVDASGVTAVQVGKEKS